MCSLLSRYLSIVLGFTACFGPVLADETEHDHESVHCLNIRLIASSDVIDNQHLSFRMRNGTYYLNILPRACPGLSQSRPFMYRPSANQLCDLDVITVLDDVGFGLRPGGSCGLGMFVPIDKEELEELKASAKKQ